MAIELRIDPARPEDKDAVKNLLQLYKYDFSEFAGAAVLDNGLFPLPPDFDAQWDKLCPRTFILRAFDVDARSGEQDWHLAGFAMVSEGSLFSEETEPNQWFIEDFFVLRKYRRAGAGRYLAMHCFESFRGRWEVAEYQSNTVAQAFWRRVIGEHTDGQFEEITKADPPGWVVQLFDNSTTSPGGTMR